MSSSTAKSKVKQELNTALTKLPEIKREKYVQLLKITADNRVDPASDTLALNHINQLIEQLAVDKDRGINFKLQAISFRIDLLKYLAEFMKNISDVINYGINYSPYNIDIRKIAERYNTGKEIPEADLCWIYNTTVSKYLKNSLDLRQSDIQDIRYFIK